MQIGPWTRINRDGNAPALCVCGAPATSQNAWNPTLGCCDACAFCAAFREHGVEYRRDGNQVVAIVPYTDATGSTGTEETTITSPLHLMQVLGY